MITFTLIISKIIFMKSFYCFLLILLSSYLSFSQELKGVIKDQNGLPLPGVSVMVIKTGNNTTSDFDGNFTIDAAIGDEIQFSMINFNKLILKAKADMVVQLNENSDKTLEEVVVVGYGIRKKGSITGAVIQIKTDDILKNPAQSAIQGIQGKAAGVNIVTNDEPGASPTIIIRGLGSLLGARNPLYVIDGVESYSLNGLSSNDIATIDILKDASSTAIYGQKGANGVVIISTKKGKKGQVSITYDGYFGIKQIQRKVKMADSYRFAYYNNTALGSSTYFNFTQPVNTNWLNEITQTGEVSNHAVSISGGSENLNFYLGLSNYTEKGILIGTEFKRNNILSKNEYKYSDKFKITQTFSLSIADNTPKPTSAFTNAYKQSPIVPVRYANGRFGVPFINSATGLNDITGIRFNNVGNPVAQLENTHEKNKNVTLFGSLNAELKIIKNLKFNSSFGATADWGKGFSLIPNRDIWLAENPSLSTTDYFIQNPKAPNNTLVQRRSDSYIWNWDNYFTFKKEFGRSDLTAVVGMSRTTSNNSEQISGTRFNVPVQENYLYLDFSDTNTPIGSANAVSNSHSTPVVSIAYFARLEYVFDKKYSFTAIVRREGLSAFQGNKKWGVFPAVSAGWNISEENFLKNIKLINNLKLRGGYGEVGNGNGPTFNNVAFSRNLYSLGAPSTSQPGTFVANAVDPNLTWETIKEINFGIDFLIYNRHLSGSLDFYNRKADNIILPVAPPFVLSEEPTFINSGVVTNKGMELTLRWENKIGKNINYWFGGNFSRNINEVSEVYSPYFQNFAGSGNIDNGQFTKLVVKGQPLGSFYVFQQTGYDSGGVPIFDDMVDGVAGLTDKDRVNAGSYIPTYTYGINFGMNYKKLDFSVDAYGVGGNKIYNGKRAQRFGGENVEYALLENFWTPSNTNALNPKPFNEVPRSSTYYIEDGAYLRINNITLGYTLPNILSKLQKTRIYVSAVNPFLFTKYSGFSPEVVGNNGGDPLGRAGIELDAYPTNKSFVFGVNLSF